MWEEGNTAATVPPQALSQLRQLSPQQFQQLQARLQQHLPQLQQQLSLQQAQPAPPPQIHSTQAQPRQQRLLLDQLQQQQQQFSQRQLLQQQFLQNQQQQQPPPAPRGRQRHLPTSQHSQPFDQSQVHGFQLPHLQQLQQQLRQQLQPQVPSHPKTQKSLPSQSPPSHSPTTTAPSHLSQPSLCQPQALHHHPLQQQVIGLSQSHNAQANQHHTRSCTGSASAGKAASSSTSSLTQGVAAGESSAMIPNGDVPAFRADSPQKGHRTRCVLPRSNATRHFCSPLSSGSPHSLHCHSLLQTSGSASGSQTACSSTQSHQAMQQRLPNAALGIPLLDSGVCQAENEKRNELRIALERNCIALVHAVTFDDQQSEGLCNMAMAANAKGLSEVLLPADQDRILGRCLLQEITMRQFWQKMMGQLQQVHTHDKCNLLSEQQQELSELLARHARQRAQLRQAHIHQRQEYFDKQDKQLRGLQRSLRHVFEALKISDQFIKDKRQEVAQWCDAVAQASPLPKRRRQSSPSSASTLYDGFLPDPKSLNLMASALMPNAGNGSLLPVQGEAQLSPLPVNSQALSSSSPIKEETLQMGALNIGNPFNPFSSQSACLASHPKPLLRGIGTPSPDASNPFHTSNLVEPACKASPPVKAEDVIDLCGGEETASNDAHEGTQHPSKPMTDVKMEAPGVTSPPQPSFVDELAMQLRTLQGSQEDYRRLCEKEAREVEEERQMNDYELEIEKLRQQKQQKQLLLFTLHSERQDQRGILSQLHCSGKLKRRASEVERESYDTFQRHLMQQIGYRQRQLRELRAEAHRISKVRRHRRSVQQNEQTKPEDNCLEKEEDDLWSSSSFTSSADDDDMQPTGEPAADQEAKGPDLQPPPAHPAQVLDEENEEEDEDSDEEEEEEELDDEPPDPVKALMCIYDECFTDLVFAEEEDDEEEGDDLEDGNDAEGEEPEGAG